MISTSPAADQIGSQSRLTDIDLRPDMTFGARAENVDTGAMLILSGAYIGFLPKLSAEPMVQAGQLRQVGFGELCLINHFCLLAPPYRDNEPAISAFRTVLEEAGP